ncbi:MAG TPA: alcohol dehydrogenase, partial [Pseudomonas sp.]|nr:alcohol dehydrogenase [Pseudomonas sp.]
MKAFQVRAPHEFSIAEVAVPTLAPGEVRVGVAYAGICGSDMH